MFKKIEARLIENWRQSWKFGSVILHALATSSAASYIAENPQLLNSLLYGIAPQWRFPALVFAASAWFAVGWLVRVWRGDQARTMGWRRRG